MFEDIDLSLRTCIHISMKVMKKIRSIICVAILIVAVGATKPVAALEHSSIDTNKEYASGDLQDLWYTWINTMGTQMIFIALHEREFNSPVFAFFGQYYNTTANSRLFVGNALSLMEIYNDTNRNGILDANYTAGISEVKYYLALNSSKTVHTASIQKLVSNDVTHYKWGVEYKDVDGFILYLHPDEYGYGWSQIAAIVFIEHVGLFFDYSLEQNTTKLKTTFQLGNVTILERTDPSVTIDGLSLSLLFTTQVISPKGYTITTNEGLFNSTQNHTQSSVNLAKIRVGNITAYEFHFEDNYTLYEGHAAQYPAKYFACPIDSVQSQMFESAWLSPLWRAEYYLKEILPEIGNFTVKLSLNYTTSSFIYRIAYPQWSGGRIEHDPTYVSFVAPQVLTQMFPAEAVAFVSITGVIVLILALYEFRKIGAYRLPTRTHFNVAC